MASRDPAFQWETEMLRSVRPRPHRATHGASDAIDDVGDWLTLSEASEATGVPRSTIRKWAKHENIPSLLEKTADGYLRVVSMRGIERWTDEIGRDVEGLDHRDGASEVDLTSDDTTSAEPSEPTAPDGSMIVPLDAWNRMLNQLGNLHEAGQQLAEARERAAKAETEAGFLKERLADLREELERTRKPTSDPVEPATAPLTSVVRKVYEGWRGRRRNRD